MNKKFLYTKPSIIGILDSSNDDFNDIGSWIFDDSPDLLRKKFRESALDELVIELVEIVGDGFPNYKKMSSLFGFVNIIENKEEDTILWSLSKIERMNDDIIKVDMYIDSQNLIIHNITLSVNELPNLKILKNKLEKFYGDISFQELSKGFVIAQKDCNVTVLKDIGEI